MSDFVPAQHTPPGGMIPGQPAGPRGPAPYGMQPDDTIDLREVLALLRRHVLLIALITLAAAGVAAYFAFTAPDQYRAYATVRLRDERQAMTGGLEDQALEQVLGKTADPVFSQLEVLRSRAVLAQVVERVGLRLRPISDGLTLGALREVEVRADRPDTLRLQFGRDRYSVARKGARNATAAAYGSPVSLDGVRLTVAAPPGVESGELALLTPVAAVETVLENLRARPLEKTDVIRIEYTSTDPVLAQAVVNATVDVFQERSAGAAQELSRRRRLFLEDQLLKTDSSLAAAQDALSDFRRREGVYSSREQFAAQQAGMLELDMRREELAAERRMYAALLSTLRQGERSGESLRALVSAPGIAQNPVVMAQFEQLSRYRAARDSLTTGPWGSAASNPDVARLNALIANAEGGLIDAARGQVVALDARLRSLGELRGRSEAEIQLQPEKEAEEMRLVQRLETVSKVADQLREEYQKATIAEAVEVGQVEVVDRAALPHEPIGSGRGLKLALGLMLGLMLGSGTAFLKEHLNTRVSRREELEPLLAAPVLGAVPSVLLNGRNGRRESRIPALFRRAGNGHAVTRPGAALIALQDGHSAGAEAFRSVRTNLLFSRSTQRLQTLVITSSMPAEGKSTTAANLAIAFAQQGMRVVVVDADLRRSSLHRLFDISREPGLVNVLGEATPLADVLRPGGVPGLEVISAGPVPYNPAELLGSTRMQAVLEELKQTFDLVIVDTPPILAAGDASVLSAMADGTVLVVRAGYTDREAARGAGAQVRAVGGRLLGSILNDPEGVTERYGSYYYSSYYGS